MEIEKLKPWNWFKHEENVDHPIPVSRNKDKTSDSETSRNLASSQNPTIGSLMQLHDEMDRLFDSMWRSVGLPTSSRFLHPARDFGTEKSQNIATDLYSARLDVAGSENEYEITIDLPGLSEDDVKIELVGSNLTIKGKKEESSETKDKHFYRVERSVGAFSRTLALPEDANSDDISANMKNGVLSLTIPRKSLPATEAKNIPIK